jgi:hypothetical protein
MVLIDEYYQKYEPKASQRLRESGGVSARRGLKEAPLCGREASLRISNEGSARIEKSRFREISSLITPERDYL